MKLDLLVFAAHPDDAELGCSGTIFSNTEKGRKVGVVDLTQGELGTRGSAEQRREEAAEAARIMGLSARENLQLSDGFFSQDKQEILEVVKALRKFRPEIVFANAIHDRHPDHGNGSALVSRACFLSGLPKIQTTLGTQKQEAWRPKVVYHYIQDRYIHPDFIVDITPYWEKKLLAVKAFRTQFFDPGSSEPVTYISNADYLPFLEGRARELGHTIGVRFGEGFTKERHLGVKDVFDFI